MNMSFINCQCEGFRAHEMVMQVLSTIEPRMVNHFLSTQSNLFETHMFLVSLLGATPTHIPLEYRCPIKISNQIRDFQLPYCIFASGQYNHQLQWKISDKETFSYLIVCVNISILPFIVRTGGFQSMDHATIFRSFKRLHITIIFVNLRLSHCLRLIHGPQQHGLMFGTSSYLNHLHMSS